MQRQTPWLLEPAQGKELPILLSSPHSGVGFPEEVQAQIKAEHVNHPRDTDWFIHELYGFAPNLGMTLIHAPYSRYVIDLNRDPAGAALYGDGRRETALVPVRAFDGEALYEGEAPGPEEVARRREAYFDPYHSEIRRRLKDLRTRFDQVLFFDCHSIARRVSSIQEGPFPDLILGNQDGRTCSPALASVAQSTLESSPFGVSMNHPFKGGFLTRSMGQPDQGIHALQLEMSNDLYLEGDRLDACPELRETLQNLLLNLAKELGA